MLYVIEEVWFYNKVSCIALHTDTSRIWDNPFDGMVRLTGGSYHNEGLLEVYCNGEWGTVCNNIISYTAAQVACRQLGYRMVMDYNHLTTL